MAREVEAQHSGTREISTKKVQSPHPLSMEKVMNSVGRETAHRSEKYVTQGDKQAYETT